MQSEEEGQREGTQGLLVRGLDLVQIIRDYRKGARIADIAARLQISRETLNSHLLRKLRRPWRQAVAYVMRRRVLEANHSRKREKALQRCIAAGIEPPKPTAHTKAQKRARAILRRLRPDIWDQRQERLVLQAHKGSKRQKTALDTKRQKTQKGQKAPRRALIVPCPKCSGPLVLDDRVSCYGQRCTETMSLEQMCDAAYRPMLKDSAAQLV